MNSQTWCCTLVIPALGTTDLGLLASQSSLQGKSQD